LDGVPVVEAADFDRAVEKTIEHVLDIMLVEHDGMLGAGQEGPG
jgi:hypothetical protein